MDTRLQGFGRQVVAFLVLVVVAAGLWGGWLGWDQERDVQPDGSSTGPYEAWQVVGLGVCLLAVVVGAALWGCRAEVALGVSAGVTGAAYLDWSDDSSGLFIVGVLMVAVGSLVGATAVSVGVRSLFSDRSC
ncbi:hypothetical protein QD712_37990 [Streptomyces acidiscabies]|uniref:hypothetical protein n=1 Tax=Streptomyces acidiscabies TaxID=42234 RepID=UPI0030CFE615